MACSIVERVKRSLDNIELGKWSELTIQQCVDKIDWLASWKKVPEEVWVPLCEQATLILDAETEFLKSSTYGSENIERNAIQLSGWCDNT